MKIVIEVGDNQNSNIMFNPHRKELRGRWDRHRLPAGTTSVDKGLLAVESLPGARIEVDTETKIARIYDPLKEDPEWAAKMPGINAVLKIALDNANGFAPFETQVMELNDDGLATWVYWMKRLVQSKKAWLHEGSTFPEQNPPGRIRVDFFNYGQKRARYLHELAPEAAQAERSGRGGKQTANA